MMRLAQILDHLIMEQSIRTEVDVYFAIFPRLAKRRSSLVFPGNQKKKVKLNHLVFFTNGQGDPIARYS